MALKNKAVLALILAIFSVGCYAEEPRQWGECPDIQDDVVLPKISGLSRDQVIRLIIPDYDKKVREAGMQMRDNGEDYEFPFSCYGGWLGILKRSDLGIPKADFLLVMINELRGLCSQCNYASFGIIDLATHRVYGRAEDGGYGLRIEVRFRQGQTDMAFQVHDDACCGNGSIRETRMTVITGGNSIKSVKISEPIVINEW